MNRHWPKSLATAVISPSKHVTLTQCWTNSGSPSAMQAQHQTSTGSTRTPRVCWEEIAQQLGPIGLQDAYPMLGRCRSVVFNVGPDQTNNGPMSCTCRVSRLSNTDPLWWAIIIPTLDRHHISAVIYL